MVGLIQNITNGLRYVMSICLTLFMFNSVQSAGVWTSWTGDGSGTENDPYLIKDINDLKMFRSCVVKDKTEHYVYVRLEDDIDFTNITVNDLKNIIPICGWQTSGQSIYGRNQWTFYGEFDGNNKVIKNIDCNNGDNGLRTVDVSVTGIKHYAAGFFGMVGVEGKQKSIIKNLIIEKCTIKLKNYFISENTSVTELNDNLRKGCGILAGYIVNTDVDNVITNECNIDGEGTRTAAAGLIRTIGSDCKVSNCCVNKFECVTNNDNHQSVGIAGIAMTTKPGSEIYNCHVYKFNFKGVVMAGLFGQHEGTAQKCGANGTFYNKTRDKIEKTGGFVSTAGNGGVIKDCFANIKMDFQTCPLDNANVCALLIASGGSNSNVFTMENCYFSGKIYASDNIQKTIARYIGDKLTGNKTFKNCFVANDARDESVEYEGYGGENIGKDNLADDPKSLSYNNEGMATMCFANEMNNVSEDRVWSYDFTGINDGCPILIGSSCVDIEPADKTCDIFCAPIPVTGDSLSTPIDSKKANLKAKGSIKFVPEYLQNQYEWEYGISFSINKGKDWTDIKAVDGTITGNVITFSADYEHKKSQTVIYKAYVKEVKDENGNDIPEEDRRKACGISKLGYEGTLEVVEKNKCDSMHYNGNIYFYDESRPKVEIIDEEEGLKIIATINKNDTTIIDGTKVCEDASVLWNGQTQGVDNKDIFGRFAITNTEWNTLSANVLNGWNRIKPITKADGCGDTLVVNIKFHTSENTAFVYVRTFDNVDDGETFYKTENFSDHVPSYDDFVPTLSERTTNIKGKWLFDDNSGQYDDAPNCTAGTISVYVKSNIKIQPLEESPKVCDDTLYVWNEVDVDNNYKVVWHMDEDEPSASVKSAAKYPKFHGWISDEITIADTIEITVNGEKLWIKSDYKVNIKPTTRTEYPSKIYCESKDLTDGKIVLKKNTSYDVTPNIPCTLPWPFNTNCKLSVYGSDTTITDTTYYNIAGDPFWNTCPETIKIQKHEIEKNPRRETTIDACDSYTLMYKGVVKGTFTNSEDFTLTHSGNNPSECQNDTFVTYHINIHKQQIQRDTIHALNEYVLTKLDGSEATYTYDGLSTTPGTTNKTTKVSESITVSTEVCPIMRETYITIHKSNIINGVEAQGCDSYTYSYLDTDKGNLIITPEEGKTKVDTTFSDTLKHKCKWCKDHDMVYDSIVRKDINIVVGKTLTMPMQEESHCDPITLDNGTVISETTVINETTTGTLAYNGGCNIITPKKYIISRSSVVNKNIDTCGTLFKYEIENIDGTKSYEEFSNNTSSTKTFPTRNITINKEEGCTETINLSVTMIVPTKEEPISMKGCDLVSATINGKIQDFVKDTTVTDTLEWSDKCHCPTKTQAYDIKVSHPVIKNENVTICNRGTVTCYGQTKYITESGIYEFKNKQCEECCEDKKIFNVTVIPVEITKDTVDACGKYTSVGISQTIDGCTDCVGGVWNYPPGGGTLTNEKTIYERTLRLYEPSTQLCKDSTYLTVRVHGSRTVSKPAVSKCESYTYTKLNGKDTVFYATKLGYRDTLFSKACDCDSLIYEFDVKITNPTPKEEWITETVKGCDSVSYTNRSGDKMTFYANAIYEDVYDPSDAEALGTCPDGKYIQITVHPSTISETVNITDCGFATVGETETHTFTESGTWKEKVGVDDNECPIYKEYNVTINPTTSVEETTNACGSITIDGVEYTSEHDKVKEAKIILAGETKCDPMRVITLNVYPTYTSDLTIENCFEAEYKGTTYTTSTTFIDELKTVTGGCDSLIRVNIVVNSPQDVEKTITGCGAVDFDGTSYSANDVVTKDKTDEHDCHYQEVNNIHVTPISRTDEDAFICFKNNKAVYKGKTYTKNDDGIQLVETETSKITGCDSLIVTTLNFVYPIYTDVSIDSCMYLTFSGQRFTDSLDVIETLKSVETGCDSIVHYSLNVNKCFEYPILVNKYDWILICNNEILTEERFKDNVSYNWYRNGDLVGMTYENYYTEDRTLNGCYQVGIVIEENGTKKEFRSDNVCIENEHSLTLTPNPVEKGQEITIECNFPDEGAIDAKIEIFSATAVKVYTATAESSTIVIPGLNVSGHYFVKITTVTGNVAATKFVVK